MTEFGTRTTRIPGDDGAGHIQSTASRLHRTLRNEHSHDLKVGLYKQTCNRLDHTSYDHRTPDSVTY
jgi:hypothetical protein